MKEVLPEIDPALKAEWEDKLRAAGEPAIDDANTPEILPLLPEGIIPEQQMLKFKALPLSSKQMIIDDVINQRSLGTSVEDIVARVGGLIERSQHFTDMDEGDSEEVYRPTPSQEESKLKEEVKNSTEAYLEQIQKVIDQLVVAMEDDKMVH